MDSSDIEPIDRFKNDIRYRDKIVHVETIPSKKAKYKKIDNLNGRIIDYLESKGVKLYEHQAEAYEHIQNKENIIITTPTASGKTLAFNLPIMETMIEDEEAYKRKGEDPRCELDEGFQCDSDEQGDCSFKGGVSGNEEID